MFNTVLIANRGEIAVRILRTLKRLGIRSVAVYAHEDRHSPHVALADQAIALDGPGVAETYLDTGQILAAARQSGAQAVIPGYGFLSENADFAEACAAVGIAFVGPTPDQMRAFGLKHSARALAQHADVPLLPGSGLLRSLDEARSEANRLGYPVMLKTTAGGGGIGLSHCNNAAELDRAFEAVQRQGHQFFGDGGVFLERYVANARHVEIQIFGDGNGRVIALGDRDCSLQRRHQKVIEETPAPNLPEGIRDAMSAAAVSLGQSVDYRSAGTVEFIVDTDRGAFYFLEVNTRLQVEHPVTEAVTGIDLVEWMLTTAAGEGPDLTAITPEPKGAAMEIRLYAEDPQRDFQPCPGELTEVRWPKDGARIDTWVETGTEVSARYDPLLAKLIVHGDNRPQVLQHLRNALDATRLMGITTNLDYLRQAIELPALRSASMTTRTLDDFQYAPQTVEVLDAGTYTTVQDCPGRVGYWHIGVPPSGPMDDYAFRLANRVVGNAPSAAGLEATLVGPKLRFHRATVIALTGAPTDATLDGEPVPFWTPVTVKPGQVLTTGRARQGCRTYLAIRGGIDVPEYLGSRATFALGRFGGHGGRPLRPGDTLALGQTERPDGNTTAPAQAPMAADPALVPDYPSHWEIGVLYGPHGAPDFFTEASIERFFSQDWEVHYNSNRLGIRLKGPKPEFSRPDGGEAGLHPSNIHDCQYAIGSINFTGDMPVILTRDGPSLGGFVCPVTIASAELWKVGQVKPGDTIRFVAMDHDTAVALRQRQRLAIETLQAQPAVAWHRPKLLASGQRSATLLAYLPASAQRPAVTYRRAGDQYILLEYGDDVLDLGARLRVHALMEAIEARRPEGLLELSPGVRSLQLRYEPTILDQQALMEFLMALEDRLPQEDQITVKSRVIHLPLAFEDSATLDAVDRYRRSVRDEAPWLPNNVDFIQRINGLPSREAVRDTLFQARYLVLGLGDVYLGAPCAVPLDPRHRLLTSKYNPARTHTAEGTVGIGGVYMCIYGMDSPGGYQLVGRTLPIWNKHLKNGQFRDGAPWLLRFFDQIQYYPVSEAELARQREQFRCGSLSIRIDEEQFNLRDHRRFLAEHQDDIERFRVRQQQAYALEAARWQEVDPADAACLAPTTDPTGEADLSGYGETVRADMAGNIWRCVVQPGDRVRRGDTLMVVEAMKMEFEVKATVSGRISALHTAPGQAVAPGEALLSIEV